MEQKLQNEQRYPSHCRYLLDVDDNHIAVNDHAILDADNPVKSVLTFQLLNPDRVHQMVFNNPQKLDAEDILKKLQNREPVEDTSYIRFFFPYGTEVGDFIDAQRGKLITFETESGDWSVAEGVIEERHISFVISCYNQKIIQTLFSVYFRCKNIQSYAPVGLTYVYAEIKNVVGIDDVIKVFPIQKKPAVPQIHRFFSDKTTTGESGQLRLQWQISGAKDGQITPGGINIFTLPAPGMEVDLNRSMEYRLSLKGNALETNAFVNLYVQPPDILQLDYDAAAKQVIWRTKYSEELQLAVGTVYKPVNENGSMEIEMPAKPQIVLRAQGHIYTEYATLHLQGLTLDKPQIFRSYVRVYPHYIHTKWTWRTQGVKEVVFQFTEDESSWHNTAIDSTGEFEYLSVRPDKPKIPEKLLGAKLICTKSDGSAYPVLLLEGEVL
ncbi:hypothetical protein YSY43_13370 [Paenibacillus sp. YSY-4.3]